MRTKEHRSAERKERLTSRLHSRTQASAARATVKERTGDDGRCVIFMFLESRRALGRFLDPTLYRNGSWCSRRPDRSASGSVAPCTLSVRPGFGRIRDIIQAMADGHGARLFGSALPSGTGVPSGTSQGSGPAATPRRGTLQQCATRHKHILVHPERLLHLELALHSPVLSCV